MHAKRKNNSKLGGNKANTWKEYTYQRFLFFGLLSRSSSPASLAVLVNQALHGSLAAKQRRKGEKNEKENN